MRRLAGHPGARGAPVWAAPGSVAGASAILLPPPLAALQLRVLVGDVGDAQRVVLQLVSIELLDGSEAEGEGRFGKFKEGSHVIKVSLNPTFGINAINVMTANRIFHLNHEKLKSSFYHS